MLFNSYAFLLQFLPLTLAAWLLARRFAGNGAATIVLLVASLLFYGHSGLRFLALLLGMVVVTYGVSVQIDRHRGELAGRRWLVAGLTLNLGVLFTFKYLAFALGLFAAAAGTKAPLLDIALPIGISFYTFEQLAYLVDVWRGTTRPAGPLRYLLFIAWFPHLIAGPIVYHHEFAPQIDTASKGPVPSNLAVGLTIFTIGLAKKLLVADAFGRIASPVFDAAATGVVPGTADGWIAMLAYGLQIYFDFSAYSDMAIGLGRMFGFVMPLNFASPYRSRSIVEFWRRWHITLSRFLRDHLYVALGGSRGASWRRPVNIMATMLLGGLWHGAGVNFVLWGGMHGAMIVANHVWCSARLPFRLPASVAWGLTMLGVFLAWVPFRAADMATTGRMYGSLLGGGTLHHPDLVYGPFETAATILQGLAPASDPSTVLSAVAVLVGLLACVLAPNTQTLLHRWQPGLASPGYETGIDEPRAWTPRDWSLHPGAAVAVGLLLATCILKLNDVSEFIYFRF